MEYLTTDDVIQMNESEVGPNALVDFGLLESAVLRPQQSLSGQDAYPDLHSKAAALFHSLVRNHPFLDGNQENGCPCGLGVLWPQWDAFAGGSG